MKYLIYKFRKNKNKNSENNTIHTQSIMQNDLLP